MGKKHKKSAKKIARNNQHIIAKKREISLNDLVNYANSLSAVDAEHFAPLEEEINQSNINSYLHNYDDDIYLTLIKNAIHAFISRNEERCQFFTQYNIWQNYDLSEQIFLLKILILHSSSDFINQLLTRMIDEESLDSALLQDMFNQLLTKSEGMTVKAIIANHITKLDQLGFIKLNNLLQQLTEQSQNSRQEERVLIIKELICFFESISPDKRRDSVNSLANVYINILCDEAVLNQVMQISDQEQVIRFQHQVSSLILADPEYRDFYLNIYNVRKENQALKTLLQEDEQKKEEAAKKAEQELILSLDEEKNNKQTLKKKNKKTKAAKAKNIQTKLENYDKGNELKKVEEKMTIEELINQIQNQSREYIITEEDFITIFSVEASDKKCELINSLDAKDDIPSTEEEKTNSIAEAIELSTLEQKTLHLEEFIESLKVKIDTLEEKIDAQQANNQAIVDGRNTQTYEQFMKIWIKKSLEVHHKNFQLLSWNLLYKYSKWYFKVQIKLESGTVAAILIDQQGYTDSASYNLQGADGFQYSDSDVFSINHANYYDFNNNNSLKELDISYSQRLDCYNPENFYRQQYKDHIEEVENNIEEMSKVKLPHFSSIFVDEE